MEPRVHLAVRSSLGSAGAAGQDATGADPADDEDGDDHEDDDPASTQAHGFLLVQPCGAYQPCMQQKLPVKPLIEARTPWLTVIGDPL